MVELTQITFVVSGSIMAVVRRSCRYWRVPAMLKLGFGHRVLQRAVGRAGVGWNLNVRHWALFPISNNWQECSGGISTCYKRSWTGVSLQMFPLVA